MGCRKKSQKEIRWMETDEKMRSREKSKNKLRWRKRNKNNML